MPGEPVPFLNRYRLNKRPGITLPGINDFQAVHAVLQERAELWNQPIVETVRQIGVREGRLEGEARILGRHLIHRFGPLSDWGEQRLAAATGTELEVWTDTVLVANSLAEVFAPPSANDARHAEPAWIHLTVAGRRLSPRPWQTGYPVAWAGWRMRSRQGRAPDRPVGHIRAELEAVPPSRDAH